MGFCFWKFVGHSGGGHSSPLQRVVWFYETMGRRGRRPPQPESRRFRYRIPEMMQHPDCRGGQWPPVSPVRCVTPCFANFAGHSGGEHSSPLQRVVWFYETMGRRGRRPPQPESRRFRYRIPEMMQHPDCRGGQWPPVSPARRLTPYFSKFPECAPLHTNAHTES